MDDVRWLRNSGPVAQILSLGYVLRRLPLGVLLLGLSELSKMSSHLLGSWLVVEDNGGKGLRGGGLLHLRQGEDITEGAVLDFVSQVGPVVPVGRELLSLEE